VKLRFKFIGSEKIESKYLVRIIIKVTNVITTLTIPVLSHPQATSPPIHRAGLMPTGWSRLVSSDVAFAERPSTETTISTDTSNLYTLRLVGRGLGSSKNYVT